MILGRSVKVILPLIVGTGNRVVILIVVMRSRFSKVGEPFQIFLSYILWY